jgi:VanZ family protein
LNDAGTIWLTFLGSLGHPLPIAILYVLVGVVALVLLYCTDGKSGAGTVAHLVWLGCSLTVFTLLGHRHFGRVLLPALKPMALLGLMSLSAYSLLRSSRRKPNLMLMISSFMAGFLAYASSAAGGPDPMYQWLFHTFGLTPESAWTSTILIRKSIHFTYFGLIALFAYKGAVGLAAIPQNRNTAIPNRAILFALLWTATFAAFDEISQLSSPGRTGSILDFALDMLGAGAFVAFAVRRNSRESQDSASR